jgi:hypothetical protein
MSDHDMYWMCAYEQNWGFWRRWIIQPSISVFEFCCFAVFMKLIELVLLLISENDFSLSPWLIRMNFEMSVRIFMIFFSQRGEQINEFKMSHQSFHFCFFGQGLPPLRALWAIWSMLRRQWHACRWWNFIASSSNNSSDKKILVLLFRMSMICASSGDS